MLACKRPYWMYKEVVVFLLIISFGLTLFITLRFELGRLNNSSSRRGAKNGHIHDATIHRNNEGMQSARNIFTQHTQFKDFEEKGESMLHVDRAETEMTAGNSNQGGRCKNFNSCFNFERCVAGFNVYVHPSSANQFVSTMYALILEAIGNNSHITTDPSKACLFVLSLDTLDRDRLSSNYMKDLRKKVAQLNFWNNGENHFIINMFSGTWPDYSDALSFDYGSAMIAKASFSVQSYRWNYDVSLPLLPKNFPLTNNLTNIKKNVNLFPIRRKYLLVFKGKRYLTGIGSESRNSFYLINNDKDIILLTSCRHNGKDWEKLKDDRCDGDNEKYDRYDYADLMSNSTFCLIPRGRRLGSFRLLEAMEHGCIPVIISNGWVLPFADTIDWSRFAIIVDERLLLHIPTLVRSLSDREILWRRQQTLFVWKTYFSSVETVVNSMIELLRERIQPNLKRHFLLWNQPPGALKVDAAFSTSPLHYPYYVDTLNVDMVQRFTAVIVAVSPVYRSSSPLFQLIKSINLSLFLDQILVVWLPTVGMPEKSKWPKTRVTLRVIHPPKKDMTAKYNHMGLVRTDAVFTFNEDVLIDKAEIDFAFSVWRSNPSQLVGFSTGLHLMSNTSNTAQQQQQQQQQQHPAWDFTTDLANQFSTIDTSSALFHRYYSHYLSSLAPPGLYQLVERDSVCESIAMKFIVAWLSEKPPIKVARSLQFKDGGFPRYNDSTGFNAVQHHKQAKRRCLRELVQIFRDMPLMTSQLSLNPILFRDPVSIGRKKFRPLG